MKKIRLGTLDPTKAAARLFIVSIVYAVHSIVFSLVYNSIILATYFGSTAFQMFGLTYQAAANAVFKILILWYVLQLVCALFKLLQRIADKGPADPPGAP